MSNDGQSAGVSPVVRVRIAELGDAEVIKKVINAAFRIAEGFFVSNERIDLPEVRASLKTGKFLLAEVEGTVIGCVYVEPRGDRSYLGLLAVDPQRQQAGLGSLLMDAAENYCRDLSCRYMDIKVVNLRKELPGFYAKRGYVETGTSPFPPEVETKLACHFIDMSKPLI
jgi:N-acetylglutamate synthase-like GNAT family acetyltransferase